MEYKKLLINQNKSLVEAMNQLDKTAKKILFVVDDYNKLIGSLTDGDIRRYILKTGSLEAKVENVCNKNTLKSKYGYEKSKIIKKAKELNIKYIPVISENEEIIEILILEDEIIGTRVVNFKPLSIPVVIMAGGIGSRLEPFTKVLPKPLIPIGDKTILEIIMEKFSFFGVNEFYISVNYKAYIIKSYLSELNLPYKISYIQEDKPLGTAGSLYLLKGALNTSQFILTNCDIIVDIDYISLLDFHVKNKNDVTVITSAQQFKIPYGVCEIEKGLLKKIKEKPEFNFLVNTGMYIFNSELLNYLPDNHFFHTTDWISILKEQHKKIGIYPISDTSWIDIGQWEEYKKAIERIRL